MLRSLVTSVGLSAAALAAQSGPLIVPAAMAGVEGPSSSVIPFGFGVPVRYQCVYDADELPFGGPMPIGELRFRADWNDGNPIPQKAWLRVDLDLSTSSVRSDRASGTFDDNHGIDRTRALSFQQIALPPQPPWTAGTPRPAEISLPLPAPWWYATTPARAGEPPGSLVVDLHVVSQPAGTYPLDSPFACDSSVARFGQRGPNCMTAAGALVELDSSDDIRAGGRVDWTVTNMPAGAAFALLVWLDATGDWIAFDELGNPLPQVVPLPAPLHPFATDCWVNVRLDGLSIVGMADAAGVARAGLPIPGERGLVGTTLHAQALVRDLAANRFGHVTSLGVRSTVCGPLGCVRIYRIGDASAVTGSVTLGAASVLEIR